MAKFKWPTDPPGKPASHSISWQQHQHNSLAGQIGKIRARGLDPNPLGVGGSAPPPTPGPGAPQKGFAPGESRPPVAPQPFDPAFEAYKLGAQWNASLAGAEAGYQRDNLAFDTGYDASGNRFTANPYSQAQLLEDSYHRSQTGTNNSMAAQGQLYSGARLNAQARNDRLYSQSSSALKVGAQRGYHGISYGQLAAYGQNAAGVSQADFDSLRNATYGK